MVQKYNIVVDSRTSCKNRSFNWSLFELALGPFHFISSRPLSLVLCPWNASAEARAPSARGVGRVLKLALSRVFFCGQYTRTQNNNADFVGIQNHPDFHSEVNEVHVVPQWYLLYTL